MKYDPMADPGNPVNPNSVHRRRAWETRKNRLTTREDWIVEGILGVVFLVVIGGALLKQWLG